MDLTHDIPSDPEALRTLVLKQRELVQRQHERIQHLEHDNRILFKIAFGRSSERRPVQVTGDGSPQGWLFAQEIVAEAARLADAHASDVRVHIPAHTRRKKQARRGEFPEGLPRVQTICELPESDRKCDCGGELRAFAEEVTRELERIETAIVHEIVRKKYSCPRCQSGVRTAPWRGRVIDKGLLGPGFLAQVIVDRFAHHMPYYRLERKYAGEGLDLSRSVLCESMARCAEDRKSVV